MSEFRVEVVTIGKVESHPNADRLDIIRVWDYPVISMKDQFKEGDKAVYVSVDALVPHDDPRWEFLSGHHRIKAKKLRGVFSMGLLTDADPSWEVGKDVSAEMNIRKYEPPEPLQMGGDNEVCVFDFPHYTDIEGLRKNPGLLQPNEEVMITEKIHGANGRWVFSDNRLWVGSHHMIKKEDGNSLWWKVANQYGLADCLALFPDIVFFGEVYGWIQDLRYGTHQNEFKIAMFDAMDLKTRRYFDVDEFFGLIAKAGLPVIPVAYRGPWSDDLRSMAEGQSTVEGADNIREGVVIRPVKERWDDKVGRVILKIHGEGYLTRKEKK